MMSKGLHILGFQNKLKTEKDFLKSLLCQNLSKRKLILEKSMVDTIYGYIVAIEKQKYSIFIVFYIVIGLSAI